MDAHSPNVGSNTGGIPCALPAELLEFFRRPPPRTLTQAVWKKLCREYDCLYLSPAVFAVLRTVLRITGAAGLLLSAYTLAAAPLPDSLLPFPHSGLFVTLSAAALSLAFLFVEISANSGRYGLWPAAAQGKSYAGYIESIRQEKPLWPLSRTPAPYTITVRYTRHGADRAGKFTTSEGVFIRIAREYLDSGVPLLFLVLPGSPENILPLVSVRKKREDERLPWELLEKYRSGGL